MPRELCVPEDSGGALARSSLGNPCSSSGAAAKEIGRAQDQNRRRAPHTLSTAPKPFAVRRDARIAAPRKRGPLRDREPWAAHFRPPESQLLLSARPQAGPNLAPNLAAKRLGLTVAQRKCQCRKR